MTSVDAKVVNDILVKIGHADVDAYGQRTFTAKGIAAGTNNMSDEEIFGNYVGEARKPEHDTPTRPELRKEQFGEYADNS